MRRSRARHAITSPAPQRTGGLTRNVATALDVSDGQTITRGQQLGLAGSTGLSTSCHLHLALWVDGVNVDPAPYINA